MESLSLAPKQRPHKVDAPLADDGVLPTDVLRDVLLRLPAKELCRLRLVCRSWRSLTSDPVFVTAHTSRHPLVAGLHKDLREVHIAELLSGNIVRRITVPRDCIDLSTQRDVVCASAYRGGDPPCFLLGKGQHEVLTLPELAGCNATFPSVLGYVPSTGEYKVLFFLLHGAATNEGQPCYVIRLGSGGGRSRWRVAPRPALPVDMLSGNRAVIEGVAYFLHDRYVTVSLEPDSIASFDMAAEEWRPTPIRGPLSSIVSHRGGDKLSYKKDRQDFQLTELVGSLVIVHCKYQDCLMDLWFLMDVDMGTWCKRYSMQYAPKWVYSRYCFYPIVILDDGRIVMRSGWVMRAYDPRTSTWTTVMGTKEMYIAVGTYSMLLCS